MKQEETIDKGVSRRAALKLLGAQIGVAAAGCSKPSEEIVPYVRMPERLVPGMPLRFATTLPLSGFGRGVICTSVEGRPIKVEGNPLHPASLGATDVFAEAAVLSLYDPDRSQVVRHAGEISTWEAFAAELSSVIGNSATRGGDGLRLLTGPITSPTLLRQIASLRNRYPKFVWHFHDPLENGAARDGAVLAFERPLLSVPQFRASDIIVSFDADPLGPGVSQIANARGFSARRRVRKSSPTSARLYVIEASPSLTGANADHRLALPPDRIAALVVGLGRQLGADLPDPHLA
ncbi:MAG: 4Fe-4S ferredoxin, partial [Hyphomicrobiales bacterium]|nr:4Fe-4S ferredoxin [Hyphomicrobiales bacterium]